MTTPQQRAGQTRKEARLIREFGPKSREVQDYRLEVLKGLGVYTASLKKELPELLDQPLAKTRPLAQRQLTTREIAALAKRDTRDVTRLLDKGIAPWEIVRSNLHRPSKKEQAARLITRRQEALPALRAMSQPDAPIVELGRFLGIQDRRTELER